MTTPRKVLISGVPATGKTHFAEWLHENYGFAHHNVDQQGPLPADWLQQDRFVIDWGFPANGLALSYSVEMIQSWISSGVEHWWFDGDRKAARKSFLTRNTVPKEAWDIQFKGINKNWETIAALFPPDRRLSVISSGPTYLPNDEIYRAMFRSK